MTFEAYSERFLERAESQLKYSTWKDYTSVCRLRLIPALGDLRLADLQRRHVNDLEAQLRSQGLSGCNVAKHLRVLSSIFSEACEDGEMTENPATARRKRRRTRAASQTKRANPYTRDEIEKLLNTALRHVEPRGPKTVYPFRSFHPLLLTLARTGLRLGEALALQWGDVDWNTGTLHVRRSYTHGRLDAPKSGKGRVVDLSSQLKATLRELYDSRFGKVVALDGEAEAERRGARLEAWVFPSETGGLIDESNLRRRVWLPLLAAAELRHTRIHDLRHAYASLLLEMGTEIQYVQAQLGHHSAAFTLKVYGHLLPRDRRGCVDRLDAPEGSAAALETNGLSALKAASGD